MLCLLRAWKTGNSTAPVLFQDLIAYSELGTEAPLFVRSTLGSAWAKWFRNDVAAEDVIPRQVLDLVLHALEKLKLEWDSEKAAKATGKAAAGSYTLLVGAAKKRRAEAVDAHMAIASSQA